MFNVIMRHHDWNDPTGALQLDRMFYYTDEGIAARFSADGRPLLDELRAFPCLFIPEGRGEEICRVGTVTAARITGNEVRYEYALDPDVPPMTNGSLFALRRQLDMDQHRYHFDWSTNHWAVKDVDLYRFLLHNVNPRRMRPAVFNIPEREVIDPTLVSVMMPFSAGFAAVYEAIQAAAGAVGLQTNRADNVWEHHTVIQDVVNLIDRARIVVCDLTGKNPNVFYEAGIAHTLGREVVIITQSEHDVPFDLRHHRFLQYHPNGEGLAALTEGLHGRMATLVGR
jgi:hypothetical protein